MLHVHTIGRIGKDCQVIAGAHGSFMAMNIAVDDYAKGQNVTTWVKVRSNKENHIRLAEYLTKGRLVLVEGTLSSSLWTDKNGESQIQLSITAESIAFINTGKKDNSAGSPGDGMDWTMVYAVSGSQGNRPAAGMVYAGFSLHHRQK